MDYTTRFGAAVTMRTVKGTPERDIMAAALAAFIGALWAGQFLVTTIWGIAFVMGNQGISFERQISRPVLCLSFSLVLSLGLAYRGYQ